MVTQQGNSRGRGVWGISIAILTLLAVGVSSGIWTLSRSADDRQPSAPVTHGPMTYGITLDNVTDIAGVTDYLSSLPGRRPMVRIVFDQWRTAESYAPAVRAIAPHADIMGQLLDSSAMSHYSVDEYTSRAREFVDAFGDEVFMWEVGNEVNGEWLGSREDVRDKIVAATDVIRSAGGRTAVTLFYNPYCYRYAENLMIPWAETYLSEQERASFDYVFVSYYAQQCGDHLPESWDPIFREVGDLFPHSLLGFGEVGLTSPVTEETVSDAEWTMRYYYAQRPATERFIGGWFWWYARQDLVESPHLLRETYRDVVEAG